MTRGKGRFEGYSLAHFQRDLLAGVIVAVIAIPLGMAFAIASGVKPEYGIYSTILAGILVSMFGGSRFQIAGPTGAFIPVLFAIVMSKGYENLLIAGFLAGLILLVMGWLKLGALVRYIPQPVTIGFTAGIAVTIFVGQIGNFLGLQHLEKHESFLANFKEIVIHLDTMSLASLVIASLSLACLLLTPKLLPKVPGSLIGLIVASLAAAWIYPGQVATIGSTYGEIAAGLPSLHLPNISFDQIADLLPEALVIAVLGAIESLLSAVVADQMTGTRHHSNKELIGQGIANLAVPLFGGIPVTGAIARTATNIKYGAVSPVSGIVHGAVVVVILLLLAPYAGQIPLAGMAPILTVVAWNMSERKEFIHLLKFKTGDSLVLAGTFLLTVLTSLTTAVEVGLVLAAIFFIKRSSDIFQVDKVLPDHEQDQLAAHIVSEAHDCPQVKIYTVEGALSFATAHQFELALQAAMHGGTNVLLLRMGHVQFVDATGESCLERTVRNLQQNGVLVLISELGPQARQMMSRAGLCEKIGEDHIFEHTGDAIHLALTRLENGRCRGCLHDAFWECSQYTAKK